jgi:transposase InsO family protein
MRMLTN